MLSALSPRRRALMLTVMGLAAVLALVVAARVVAGRLAETDPVPQDRPGPVMLVPGYGGGTGALRELADRLRGDGREAVVVEMPDGGTGDLRKQADLLDRRVAEALRGGAPSVDVVAHSAGGVVARVWAIEHDGASKARRIVTLGTPHQGAELAAAGSALSPGVCPAACRQLVPDSALLRGLGDSAPVPPLWVSLWTSLDTTVAPRSSRLDGALNLELQSVCPDARTGHAALPSDPLAAAIVQRVLGTAPPAAPGPGDCAALRVSS